MNKCGLTSVSIHSFWMPHLLEASRGNEEHKYGGFYKGLQNHTGRLQERNQTDRSQSLKKPREPSFERCLYCRGFIICASLNYRIYLYLSGMLDVYISKHLSTKRYIKYFEKHMAMKNQEAHIQLQNFPELLLF